MPSPTIPRLAANQPVPWVGVDVPARMVDRGAGGASLPLARLRNSIWTAPVSGARRLLYGWRFQGTAEDGNGKSPIFDVYKAQGGWHVHHTYA
jgi:hypothetical protein